MQQKKCIAEFCHPDESPSIDSNSKHMVYVKRGDEVELHTGQVWNVSSVIEQNNLFLESEILKNTANLHTYFIAPSRSFLYRYRCPCVTKPAMQSCVDIIKSTTQHYMRCIAQYVRTNKEIREKLTSEPCIPFLLGHADDFVDPLCCDKLQRPDFVYGVGISRRIPSFIPWKCINNTCDKCGVNKTYKMNACLV